MHECAVLFSFKGESHAKSKRALVQGLFQELNRGLSLVAYLVGLDSHPHFVSYSNKEESSVGAVDRDLSDLLIEALCVEFFPYRADSSFPGLAGLESVVQLALQNNDILLSGWCG